MPRPGSARAPLPAPGSGLYVVSFTATPSSPVLGATTRLSVTYNGSAGPVTFTYGGLPGGCPSASNATLACTPDSAGTFNVTVELNESSGGNATSNLTLVVRSVVVPGGPEINAFSLDPATLVLGNGSILSVTAEDPDAELAYAFGGLPAGCSGANRSAVLCSPWAAGTFAVTFLVSAVGGATASVTANLTVLPAQTGPGPAITLFSAGPSFLILGNATRLNVSAQGPGGPFTFTYPLLPPGCQSANRSTLTCWPSATGNFSTYVVVTNVVGQRSGAFGPRLVVVPYEPPAPAIALFAGTPARLAVGAELTFFVETDGGRAPLSYDFADLPPGCVPVDAVSWSCRPTGIGTFVVIVTVTDALARNASASATVQVVAASHGGAASGSGGLDLSTLTSSDGLATLAFVVASALFYAGVELAMRRRAVRLEGEEIVRRLADRARVGAPPGAAPADRASGKRGSSEGP